LFDRKKIKMQIWFDTEFIEDGKTIDLISIGLVREDDHYLYLENEYCDLSRASDWVRQNVLPHLSEGGIDRASPAVMAEMIREFAGPEPEFWAYFADYDWVALCQLYGTLMDLPKGWPKFCLDVQQLRFMKGNPDLPKQMGVEHNALDDARWTKRAWEFLRE